MNELTVEAFKGPEAENIRPAIVKMYLDKESGAVEFGVQIIPFTHVQIPRGDLVPGNFIQFGNGTRSFNTSFNLENWRVGSSMSLVYSLGIPQWEEPAILLTIPQNCVDFGQYFGDALDDKGLMDRLLYRFRQSLSGVSDEDYNALIRDFAGKFGNQRKNFLAVAQTNYKNVMRSGVFKAETLIQFV